MAAKEKMFKMLKKEGAGLPYPFTESLHARRDMKIIYMTKAEIDEEVQGAKQEHLVKLGQLDQESVEEEVVVPDTNPTEPPRPTRPKVNEKRLARAKAQEQTKEAPLDIPAPTIDPEDIQTL